MALVIIDGPRGVGKTTLVKQIAQELPTHRIWSWAVLAQAQRTRKFEAIWRDLVSAHNDQQTIIIDGSWADEALQPLIASPKSALSASEFLGEWQIGRLAQFIGLRIMLLAPSQLLDTFRPPRENMKHAAIERGIYENYAKRWGWITLHNDYTPGNLITNASTIASFVSRRTRSIDPFPAYCGPANAPFIFVGTAEKAQHDLCNGTALPYSDDRGFKLGNYLDRYAIRCGWAHAHRLPPALLRHARALIATDKDAESWCWNYVAARDVRLFPDYFALFGPAHRDEQENYLNELRTEMERTSDG